MNVQVVAQAQQTNSYVMHEHVADDTYLAVLPETCHTDTVSPESVEDTYTDVVEDTHTAQYQKMPDTADNSRCQSFSSITNADSTQHSEARVVMRRKRKKQLLTLLLIIVIAGSNVCAFSIGLGYFKVSRDKQLTSMTAINETTSPTTKVSAIHGIHGNRSHLRVGYSVSQSDKVFILTSPNSECHMKFQPDANIVVYNSSNNPSPDNAVWHSGSFGNLDGVKLVLQDDGNWVKLVSNGSRFHNFFKHRIFWTSRTTSSPTCGKGQVGTRVMLEDNCKPAIYTEHDSLPLWIARDNAATFHNDHNDKKFECNQITENWDWDSEQ